MAKNTKGFIQLRNDIVECPAFDIIQAVIICKIASWQREDKKFFQSKQEIAKEFQVNRRTIQRRMQELEDKGIIYRDGKVKRSIVYKVDVYKLDMCLRVTHPTQYVTESHTSSKICTRESHYNTNNKTSNKTSFKEEDVLASSSKGKKTHISQNDIEDLANDIELD